MEFYEHNVDNLAIEVVGQNWSCEVICFPGGLGGRAGGIKLPLVDGPLCQEMRESSESLDSPCSLCSECQERR